MDFTNEIYFSKNLIQGEQILIKYSGKLFKEYSEEVSIVYGFGDDWEETEEAKMQPTEDGFEALITMKNYNTFNFCFKNNYNVWDNNFGFNYISAIGEAKNAAIEANTSEEATDEAKESEEDFNLEKAFSELLDSILEFNKEEPEETNEEGYGLQAVDEIEESDFVSCDDIFQDMYKEISVSEESNEVQDATPESILEPNVVEETEVETKDDVFDAADLENLLNEYTERQEKKNQIVTAKELDDIMDDILNSIVEEEPTEETIQNAETTDDTDQSALPVVQGERSQWLNTLSEKAESFFALISKALKKLGVLIKETAKELFSDSDND